LQAQPRHVCLNDSGVKIASKIAWSNLRHASAEHKHNITQRMCAADCRGRFVDFIYARRFGPRTHDVMLAALRNPSTGQACSHAFHRVTERFTNDSAGVG
jgi:beta-mannosidase